MKTWKFQDRAIHQLWACLHQACSTELTCWRRRTHRAPRPGCASAGSHPPGSGSPLPGRGPLIGGLLLTFIAAAFLFSLDFGNLWPVFLILGGIALLLNAFWSG